MSASRSVERQWRRLLLLALLACAAPLRAETSLDQMLAAGERLYLDGVAPSGRPVRALIYGDISLPAGQSACVNCHRRSGYGSGEGPVIALPISGPALYAPRDATVAQLRYLAANPARRPAYTDATLARAIREGVDAAGMPLAHPMPRYLLSDEDIAPLIAYLKSLSAVAAPGVSAHEVHLATVVTEGVAPEQREAMLDVLEAFVRDKNAGTRYETRRAQRGPWTMTDYRAYRTWRLHVWELRGASDTWKQQLATYYAAQPVFSMLGGLASGSWQPIHEFCEQQRLPCLFPSTQLPEHSGTDFYAMYFSKGMQLEAEVLARYLADNKTRGPLIQIVADDAEARAAADAFSGLSTQAGMTAPELVSLGSPAVLSRDDWARVLRDKRDVHLILWSRHIDFQALAPHAKKLRHVVVSTSLSGETTTVPDALRAKMLTIHPYVLPEKQARQTTRVRTWLRRKGIAPAHERIQADAYFAATVTADGLMKIANNFSREFFIERIEDMMDDALTSSVYPRVSLAPGQRFVSKGAYVLRFAPDTHEPESVWVVP